MKLREILITRNYLKLHIYMISHMDLVIMSRPHLLQDIRNAIHIMFSEYVQRNHHSIRVELSIASNRSISF